MAMKQECGIQKGQESGREDRIIYVARTDSPGNVSFTQRKSWNL
jgi:hypothetical protein